MTEGSKFLPRLAILVTLVCVSCAGLLHAQEIPPAQPNAPLDAGVLIQAETKMVLVDAVVTNRKGQYVPDLKAEDFHIKEDGKEQEIKTFSYEADPPDRAPERTHYLVLMFDNSTMAPEDQVHARKAAMKFIDDNAAPGHMMSVINFGGMVHVAQNFTAEPERLKAGVNGLQFSAVSANDAGIGAAPVLSSSTASVGQDFGARDLLLGIRTLAKGLASIPGRKILVLLTAGFPLQEEQNPEVIAAVNECNKANVAIYPLDVRGVSTGSFFSQPNALVQSAPSVFRTVAYRPPVPGASQVRSGLCVDDNAQIAQARGMAPVCSPMSGLIPGVPETATTNQQVMYMLADGTGGFVIHDSNDMVAGLTKIGKEQNQYYLLGYTPPFAKQGTCHTLQVKVSRGGVQVRSRTGYCSAKPPDPLKGDPMEKTLISKISASKSGNVTATMRLPYFYTAANVARVNVAMELASNAIKFDRKKEEMHSEVNVLGIAYTPDGAVAARFSDTLMLNFDTKQEADDVKLKPLHYESQFDIAPGKYTFKLAFSEGNQNFGMVEQPLEIEPFDPAHFALSALALSKDYHRTSMGLTGVDALVMEDKTPLVADGIQVVPSGTSVFTQSDLAIFYVEVYEPLLTTSDEQKALVVGMQIRVVDRKTGEQKYDSGLSALDPQPPLGNPVVPLSEKMPTSSLAPGSYRLEFKAVDSAGHTATRTADFDIQ